MNGLRDPNWVFRFIIKFLQFQNERIEKEEIKLGYNSFKVRVHTTGMELDIEAKYKEYGQPILVNVKRRSKK